MRLGVAGPGPHVFFGLDFRILLLFSYALRSPAALHHTTLEEKSCNPMVFSQGFAFTTRIGLTSGLQLESERNPLRVLLLLIATLALFQRAQSFSFWFAPVDFWRTVDLAGHRWATVALGAVSPTTHRFFPFYTSILYGVSES